MRKVLLTGAALVVVCGPALADFFVVQDTTTKRCNIVQEKPTGKSTVLVSGTKTYTTRDEAQSAMAQAEACKSVANANQKASPAEKAEQKTATKGSVQLLSQAPSNSWSITRLYKQAVYNSNNERIGEVDDVLITNDGRATALVIGVGGFLGLGETHVLVPFNAVNVADKDGSIRLTMNSNRDELRGATHYRFDRSKHTWGADDRRDEKKAAPKEGNKTPKKQ